MQWIASNNNFVARFGSQCVCSYRLMSSIHLNGNQPVLVLEIVANNSFEVLKYSSN
jgi:hypothetical protein